MKLNKKNTASDAQSLARVLGLTPAQGQEIEIRSDLNDKIIETVQKKKLTHAQVAKLCGSSRTRITALLNRNTQSISTDLMLKILVTLGVSVRVQFGRAA